MAITTCKDSLLCKWCSVNYGRHTRSASCLTIHPASAFSPSRHHTQHVHNMLYLLAAALRRPYDTSLTSTTHGDRTWQATKLRGCMTKSLTSNSCCGGRLIVSLGQTIIAFAFCSTFHSSWTMLLALFLWPAAPVYSKQLYSPAPAMQYEAILSHQAWCYNILWRDWMCLFTPVSAPYAQGCSALPFLSQKLGQSLLSILKLVGLAVLQCS